MKKNIAIVWGGYSSEKEVSEKSAAGIYSFIDKDKYNVFKVKIDRAAWLVDTSTPLSNHGTVILVDKNDFSFISDGKKTKFDFAYNTIHGTPGEDGTLQGYFDMLNIPYSNCGVLASALTFNKFTCNYFLSSFGIDVANSIVLRRSHSFNTEKITSLLRLPVFVKPNVGGSSFGITKVKETTQLEAAINKAFEEAPEVIIEQFIGGTEVTCGCFETEKGLTILPITEVVSKNEFFDYDAKYNGEVEEITPARIAENVAEIIRKKTKEIYRLIGAKGIIRIDYIISNGTPVLLEVNTTPGMTTTSFIPQQVAAAGLNMTQVLTDIIENEYNKMPVLENTEAEIKNNFGDIRSLNDNEVESTIHELLHDSRFKAAAEQFIAPMTWEQLTMTLKSCKTVSEFQRFAIYPLMMQLIKKTTSEIKGFGWENIQKNDAYVITSNHRDIVLDAAFLNILSISEELNTTEIAVGDNLLAFTWIEKLMRLNKSFIVKRGVSVRQMLEVSKHLSDYIHDTVQNRKQSIWIAQREGRAKDSNDKTQIALLKMLALHSNANPLKALKELQIVPLAISYEFDPTDFLKAKEMQLKRDNPEHKKSKSDDVENMMTGIMGFKGRVHFRFTDCINPILDTIPADTPKSEVLEKAAQIIDNEIYKNYSFFPFNYVAYDLMSATNKFSSKYTNDDCVKFDAYLQKQIEKIDIPNKDIDFLRKKIIEMYGNTLKNHLTAH
jgi:D-alanine--D-alanine ligase